MTMPVSASAVRSKPKSYAPVPGSTASRRRRALRLVETPAVPASKRSMWDAGTLLALSLFCGCLALAVLHAVLVQNQARLDKLIIDNQDRQEQIDRLLAEIAYLDSPAGVAEQAAKAGLVAAAEVVTLTPVVPEALHPPLPDPFGLSGLPPLVASGDNGLLSGSTAADGDGTDTADLQEDSGQRVAASGENAVGIG